MIEAFFNYKGICKQSCSHVFIFYWIKYKNWKPWSINYVNEGGKSVFHAIFIKGSSMVVLKKRVYGAVKRKGKHQIYH